MLLLATLVFLVGFLLITIGIRRERENLTAGERYHISKQYRRRLDDLRRFRNCRIRNDLDDSDDLENLTPEEGESP